MSDAGFPEITLERYRLGETTAAEAAAIERRLESDPALAQRMVELDASDATIRSDWPAHAMARAVAPRTHPARPNMPLVRWLIPAAAAAVLVLGLLPRSPISGIRSDDADGNRVKGADAALTIYRRTDSGSEMLRDGARARPGDLLRLGYKISAPAYGLIASVDGRGVVTRHLPADGGTAAPLSGGQAVLLDQAYELDDAPKWERFYFVTSPSPFAIAPVLAAIETAVADGAGAPELHLNAALNQVSVVIRKDITP